MNVRAFRTCALWPQARQLIPAADTPPPPGGGAAAAPRAPPLALRVPCQLLLESSKLRQRAAWAAALAPHVAPRLLHPAARPAEISSAVHTLAKLRWALSAQYLTRLQLAALGKLRAFSAMQLAKLCWGLGALGARPVPAWLPAVCDVVVGAAARMTRDEARVLRRGLRRMVANAGFAALTPEARGAAFHAAAVLGAVVKAHAQRRRAAARPRARVPRRGT